MGATQAKNAEDNKPRTINFDKDSAIRALQRILAIFGAVYIVFYVCKIKATPPQPQDATLNPTLTRPSTPPLPPIQYNVEFYRGKLSDPIYKKFIYQYHLINDWKFFEYEHAYIQWLFPNQFRSRFNVRSHPLTAEQAQIFRSDLTIGGNLLLSYITFTNFMGAKINIETGELETVSEDRLYQLLEINTHNHLRLTRIISCLSIVGFRHYAIQLIKYLAKEIQERNFYLTIQTQTYDREWSQYLSDEFTIGICKLVNQREIQKPHPILNDKATLEQINQKMILFYSKVKNKQKQQANYSQKKKGDKTVLQTQNYYKGNEKKRYSSGIFFDQQSQNRIEQNFQNYDSKKTSAKIPKKANFQKVQGKIQTQDLFL